MRWFMLAAYLLVLVLDSCLDWLNIRHLNEHRGQVPEGFEKAVSKEKLARSEAYTLEKGRLSFVSSMVRSAFWVPFLFAGGIIFWDRFVPDVTGNFILGGLVFFAGIHVVTTVIAVPFRLYGTFSIEERYGFNKKTLKLWVFDFIKGEILNAILLGALASAFLVLKTATPGTWWLWCWVVMILFQLVAQWLAPVILSTFHFKFEPLEVEGLEDRIRQLVEGAGFRVKGVYQIDASRRTGHTNAFFLGIGRNKRIALFDTLVTKATHGEILGILAHEVAHWKKRHVLRRMVTLSAVTFAGLLASFYLVEWGGLPRFLGAETASFYVELVALSVLFDTVTWPLKPVFSWLSRRDEYEADRYAADVTGQPHVMADAMIKLSTDNLSNLHPHPWYAAFHYSHPPDVERVAFLRSLGPPPAEAPGPEASKEATQTPAEDFDQESP